MNHEAKRLAMDAISSVKTVFQQVGYAKAAVCTGIYLAKIREADRERLGQVQQQSNNRNHDISGR